MSGLVVVAILLACLLVLARGSSRKETSGSSSCGYCGGTGKDISEATACEYCQGSGQG